MGIRTTTKRDALFSEEELAVIFPPGSHIARLEHFVGIHVLLRVTVQSRVCQNPVMGHRKEEPIRGAGHALKDNVGKRHLHTAFIAVLFATAKRWERSKHSSADGQINKMWSISTVDYCSVSKRKGNSDTLYDMNEPWGHYAK